MHKGIRLKLNVWVEGDAEPADDFAAYTVDAIRKMLSAGFDLYPQLRVEIRGIEEDRDWEDSEKFEA